MPVNEVLKSAIVKAATFSASGPAFASKSAVADADETPHHPALIAAQSATPRPAPTAISAAMLCVKYG